WPSFVTVLRRPALVETVTFHKAVTGRPVADTRPSRERLVSWRHHLVLLNMENCLPERRTIFETRIESRFSVLAPAQNFVRRSGGARPVGAGSNPPLEKRRAPSQTMRAAQMRVHLIPRSSPRPVLRDSVSRQIRATARA